MIKNNFLHIVLQRFLVLCGCILLTIACSSNDDGPVVETVDPNENEVVEEPEPETETDSEPETQEEESESELESGGETETETETESESEAGEENTMPNLVELITSEDELSLFQLALLETDLIDTLAEEELYTVFAPTNAAVEQLFVLLGDEYNSFEDFDNPIEQQILEEILLGHVVAGNIDTNDFVVGVLPTLLPEDSIELIAEDETFVIKDASEMLTNFLSFNLEAANGTVHTIDKILIPQKALSLVE